MDIEIQKLKSILKEAEQSSMDFYKIPYHILVKNLIISVLKIYERLEKVENEQSK